jgi:hypothetical protein
LISQQPNYWLLQSVDLKLAFEPIEDLLLLVPNNSSPLAWISKLDCDVNELQDDPIPPMLGVAGA